MFVLYGLSSDHSVFLVRFHNNLRVSTVKSDKLGKLLDNDAKLIIFSFVLW